MVQQQTSLGVKDRGTFLRHLKTAAGSSHVKDLIKYQ